MRAFLSYNGSMERPRRDASVLFAAPVARWIFRISAFLLFSILCSLFSASAAHAATLDVSPVILDGKGKPREILRYTVTVANTSNVTKIVYPWVATVDAKKGDLSAEEFEERQRSESLGSWIEMSRQGIAIPPGESREVPILVQLDLYAKPGNYHARLNFSPGPTAAKAEANIEETSSVLLNVEVLDDANERLQLAAFTPDKNFFGGDKASFSYKVENIGNRGVTPTGKIRIYDRKGEEVATVDANEKGEKLEPDAKLALASVWAAGDHFGRYKALLELNYGTDGRGVITDTVFFWIVPWGKLAGMFVALMVAAVIVAIVFHSYYISRRRFAPAYAVADEYEDEEDDLNTEDEAFAPPPLGVEERGGTRSSRLVEHFSKSSKEKGQQVDSSCKEGWGGVLSRLRNKLPSSRSPSNIEVESASTPSAFVRQRELTIPPPVSIYQGPAVRVARPKTTPAPETHRVTLTKPQPKSVPPEHVVRLKGK